MCIEGIEVESWQPHHVPDSFKTQKMYDKEVREDPSSLEYVPDWFVTQGKLKEWHDDEECCNDDELIRWYDGCKKCKAKKAQIKEELIPVA